MARRSYSSVEEPTLPKPDGAYVAKVVNGKNVSNGAKMIAPVAMRGGGKDQLMSDAVNTGVSAAIIGGFALGNIQTAQDVQGVHEITVYILSFIATHACTCACLTSAMMYRAANKLDDQTAPEFMEKHAFMLKLPWMKFVMGTASYIASVIALSWQALYLEPLWQDIALLIGLMSMSTVVVTGLMVGGILPAIGKGPKMLQAMM